MSRHCGVDQGISKDAGEVSSKGPIPMQICGDVGAGGKRLNTRIHARANY